MDFFARQEDARRKTSRLVFYFICAVVLIIAAVYAVFLIAFIYGSRRHHLASIWYPQLFEGVTLGTLALIGIASLIKIHELSKGGSAVALFLGGQPINRASSRLDDQKLINVVEEMAVASGTPVPEIYVLESENSINAFTAGHSTSDAVIGVTRGAIQMLNRDELQGVVAHEFSHLLNGDTRLNLRLMGAIYGILCIALLGKILLRSGAGSSRKKNALPILGLGLIVIGFVGVFFAKLIKSAVSRQREFLADASAVQFTRNPLGLAGALKKAGGLSRGTELESANAEEASHMFFANGLAPSWLPSLETHPPLEERIKLLDPSFNGQFPRVERQREEAPIPRGEWPQPAVRRPARPAPLPPLASISAVAAMASIGTPEAGHLDHAVSLLASLPPELAEAAREPFGATAIIYTLLLSAGPAVRDPQLALLRSGASDGIARLVEQQAAAMQALQEQAKIPLVELTFPALRRLSATQYEEFSALVNGLIEADQQIDLFEFTLKKMLFRHLDSHFKQIRRPMVQYYVLKPVAHAVSVLLSTLAYCGSSDPQAAAAAFQAGAQALQAPNVELEFLPGEACGLSAVDAALDELDQVSPMIKKEILQACAVAASADGVIQPREGELLRAMADAMDCPIPPIIKS